MADFDINQTISELGAAAGQQLSGSLQNQASQIQATLGHQISLEALAGAELTRAKVQEAKTKTTFDVTQEVLGVQKYVEHRAQLDQLNAGAQRNLQDQLSLADELERNTKNQLQLRQESTRTLNPFTKAVNAIELSKLKKDEQAQLRAGIQLAGIQESRAIAITSTMATYDAAVTIPKIAMERAQAIETIAKLNIPAIEAATAGMKAVTTATNKLRDEAFDVSRVMTTEQRAQDTQARQNRQLALSEQRLKLDIQKAELDLKKAREANDVSAMNPAIKAFATLAGLPSDPQSYQLGAAYIKGVAQKDPSLYGELIRLGSAQQQMEAAGQPMTQADIKRTALNLNADKAIGLLAQSGDVALAQSVSQAYDGIVRREYERRKAQATAQLQPGQKLSAAQEKEIQKTAAAAGAGLTAFQVMEVQAKQLRANVRLSSAADADDIAEPVKFFATADVLARSGALTDRQKKAAADQKFQTVIKNPVTEQGQAPLIRAHAGIDYLVKNRQFSVSEAAELMAKVYKQRGTDSVYTSVPGAAGLLQNGLDISPDKIIVTRKGGNTALGNLTSGVPRALLSAIPNPFDPENRAALQAEAFGQIADVFTGRTAALRALAGEYNITNPADLKLFYERYSKALK